MIRKMRMVATATVAAGALGLVGASSASAITITNGGNITATAPASRLVVNGAVALNCATTGATGTIPNATGLGIGSSAGFVTPTFSSCVGPAGLAFTVVCAANTTRLIITGAPTGGASGTTAGRLDPLSCTVRFTATGCTALVTGTVNGVYSNTGTLTVSNVGQNLTVSNSTCPNVLPNGTAVYGTPGATSTTVNPITYTLGAVKPQVNP